jgi:hypothetical protein
LAKALAVGDNYVFEACKGHAMMNDIIRHVLENILCNPREEIISIFNLTFQSAIISKLVFPDNI